MGKKKAMKKAMKEVKKFERNQSQSQREWAVKRGKEYPLGLADMYQWSEEELMQQRFCEMKDILINGNKRDMTPRPVSIDNCTPKPWPLWTLDDVTLDTGQHQIMSEAYMNRSIADIENTLVGTPCMYEGYTIFDLSSKYQDIGDGNGGTSFGVERVSIKLSPSMHILRHLYIGTRDKIDATFYVGYINNEDGEEDDYVSISNKTGFLVFTGKDKQKHAVKINEFCALAEVYLIDKTKEYKGYVFTYYHYANDILFIKHLKSLEDVDLFLDQDKVLNADNNKPQPSPYMKAFDNFYLTARENEIVKLILKHQNYYNIARKLNIEPMLMRNYKRSIYSKLNIHSKSELFALAEKSNIT